MSAPARAPQQPDAHAPPPQRVAIVVAGAGARGGYEAGVLSVIVPRLERAGIVPDLFVGTSAGAINATIFAAYADLPAGERARRALEIWRGISAADVFRSPVLTSPIVAGRFLGQLLGVPGVRLTGLLDTTPLQHTAQTAIDWRQLRATLDRGTVGLAVVTTSGADNRTVVFVDRAGDRAVPPPDDDRPIDYVPAAIGAEHVLASAAIPLLFPPVRVRSPAAATGWYIDGGVRLNAPLKPALALGADAVVVVATHPQVDRGDPRAAGARADSSPDLDDTSVRLMDAALVDRMIEDLHTLAKVNRLVDHAGGRNGGLATAAGRRSTVVPYLAVAPAERGELGLLAADVFERSRRGLGGALRAARRPDARLLSRLLLGDGPRRGDLLSYLYFEPEFIEASIERGRRDAAALLADTAPDQVPWRTGP